MNVSEEEYTRLQEDNVFLRGSIAELRELLRKATLSIAEHTESNRRLRKEIEEYRNNQPQGE